MSASATIFVADGCRLDRGTHEIKWDGTDDAGRSLGSGVYLIRLTREGGDRCVKAVLLR